MCELNQISKVHKFIFIREKDDLYFFIYIRKYKLFILKNNIFSNILDILQKNN